MCGIVCGIGITEDHAWAGIRASAHRGPDAQAVERVGSVVLGHARLSIIDLDARSNQPMTRGKITLAYNGELWNYRELRSELEGRGTVFSTDGDTEVIAHALDQWGIGALPKFEGMFALAWTDGSILMLARDRFGEVPLHYAVTAKLSAAASERAALLAALALGERGGARGHCEIEDVPAGGIVSLASGGREAVTRWYEPPIRPRVVTSGEAGERLRNLIGESVTERALAADVPVCTLLSGGIDSSAVALTLSELNPRLVAYTAVFDPKSRDVRCAREVASFLGIELREVHVSVPTPDDLAEVISIIEMPFKAQIEIAYPCLKLAQRIHEDGFKVTFSGEGSDELWGSYGFAYHALAAGRDWHAYRRDLFLAQARKNFMRANKVFMRYGIECRLPFLNTKLVEFALSLPRETVGTRARPKQIMSDAFHGLLPDSVLSRPKVAFQDGMGLKAEIGRVLADPRRFYNLEYKKRFA